MKCKMQPMERLRERLKRLYPLENPDTMLSWKLKIWLKLFWNIMAVVLLAAGIFVLTSQEESSLQNGNVLNRPEYNGEKLEVDVKAEIEGEEVAENVLLSVEPEQYTWSEFKQLVENAVPELEKSILGNNEGLEKITEDLLLSETVEDTPIRIEWSSDKEEVISQEGKLYEENIEEQGSVVMLTATFLYEDYKMSQVFALKAVYRPLTRQEYLKKQLLSEIEKAVSGSVLEKQIELPKEIDGKRIVYQEKQQKKAGVIAFFLLTGVLIWWMLIREELQRKERQREQQLLFDYPELISELSLLLRAGMTVSGAWRYLVLQYEKQQKRKNGKRRYVYEEMILTEREIQNGISEAEALSHFGARLKLAPYLKLSTLLSQNIRKGTKGLTDALRVEGRMAYEERKERAKQQGEEAGTKLLLPMLMMFGIVLVIILVPAFLSF